ncbi:cell division septation protein DedD [Lewinella marina]|nr:SPOR domain-containing protein [Neolewinella marina]NJB85624.1 cell division septation protein DedD [Neolewinella marina]
MNHVFKTLLFLLPTLAAVPLAAQFRSEMRTADKQLELHAYNLAIESYRRALDYRSDDVEALSRLGHAHRMLNQLDTARMYYERAMADRRVDAETLLGYAQTLRGLGEYAQAEPLFAAYARETDPTVGNHYVTSTRFAQQQRNEHAGFQAERMSINSLAADFGASVPQPGRLVFNSGRADEDFDGMAGNRPYVANLAADGTASDPVPLSFGYRIENGFIGPVSYSPDGRTVLFSRNNFTPGTRMVPEAGITLTLMVADVNPEGRWTNVRPLPFNGNDFSTGYGTFAANDDRTIYFASDRPGGYGGYDIYRASFDGRGWDAVPENVGPAVNSRGNEITPFFDGNSLFFSSDWHHGLGGYDVFRAAMEGRRPTTLYHMGAAVNSSRDDLGFLFDPTAQTGYVTSNRPAGMASSEDLYYISPATGATENRPAGADNGPVTSVPEGVSADDPVPFGAVRGYVTDIQTNLPIADATVVITRRSDSTSTTLTTDVNGAYYTSVQPYTTYDVSVDAFGYAPMNFPVTTGGGQQSDAFGNILLLPGAAGGTVSHPAPTVGNERPAPTAANDRPAAPAPAPRPVVTEPTGGGGPPAPATYDRPAATPAPGFAVQIASVSNRPNLQQFENLSTFGRVYLQEADGRFKVRLGGYADREAAQGAAQRARDLGYAGSFVVTEEGAPAARPSPAAPAPASGTPAPPPAPAPAATQAAFRVQLGAFGKPENFDRERAATLGTLRTEKRGELTVFFIDDLTSADQARSVRDRALEMGYPGAYALQLTDTGYRKL